MDRRPVGGWAGPAGAAADTGRQTGRLWAWESDGPDGAGGPGPTYRITAYRPGPAGYPAAGSFPEAEVVGLAGPRVDRLPARPADVGAGPVSPRTRLGDRSGGPGRAAVRRRQRRTRRLEVPLLAVFSLVTALLVRTLVFQTFYIPSGSMHPTLLEGDRVIVNKLSYHLHAVHRGDVVVFRRPARLHIRDEDLIKRVIGLPGDTVAAHDRKVYVNGRALDEPYIPRRCVGTDDFLKVTVPSDQVFVMGDNRCDSTDSRVFGPIREDLLVGRAFCRVWPPSRWGWL